MNDVTYRVRGAAFRVHSFLGPGLLESVYEICLAHELAKEGMRVERQRSLPVHYDGIDLQTGYRLDLVVENRLIIELKATKQLTPTDVAQLLTYMKLSRIRLGLLMNFNVAKMKDGIRRYIL